VRISTNSHGRKRKREKERKKKMSYICKGGQGAEKKDVRIFIRGIESRTHIQQGEKKEGKYELVHSSKDEAQKKYDAC